MPSFFSSFRSLVLACSVNVIIWFLSVLGGCVDLFSYIILQCLFGKRIMSAKKWIC
jgi:hypothetical protein